ncbi:hypothetical protein ACTHS7_13870, partial [Neisseria sp. P0015.S009]|uniref:hypothetical protein n=1 Tax=Neisseria sp. P0015.S009 TaxID=3436765 RepID=UPI003F7D4819
MGGGGVWGGGRGGGVLGGGVLLWVGGGGGGGGWGWRGSGQPESGGALNAREPTQPGSFPSKSGEEFVKTGAD